MDSSSHNFVFSQYTIVVVLRLCGICIWFNLQNFVRLFSTFVDVQYSSIFHPKKKIDDSCDILSFSENVIMQTCLLRLPFIKCCLWLRCFDSCNWFAYIPISLNRKRFHDNFSIQRHCILSCDMLIQKLYNLGARKFVLAGIGLMGCIQSILAQGRTGRCSEDVNQLVLPFNANMKTMINNLSTNLPGSKFVFIDVHNMFQDLLANARSYGSTYNNLGNEIQFV